MTYAKWYLFLINTKSSHRILLTGLICVTLLGAWIFFLYLPLYYYVQHSAYDIIQRKKDIQACDIAQKKCTKLQRDLGELQHEVELDCSQSAASLQHHLAAIVREVEAHGLRLIALKKVNQQDKGWYEGVQVSLSVSGSLGRIIALFEQLPHNVSLVQCDNVVLQKELNNSVTAQCMLKIFMPKK